MKFYLIIHGKVEGDRIDGYLCNLIHESRLEQERKNCGHELNQYHFIPMEVLDKYLPEGYKQDKEIEK